MEKSKVGAADSDPLILNHGLENHDTRKSPIGIGDTRLLRLPDVIRDSDPMFLNKFK